MKRDTKCHLQIVIDKKAFLEICHKYPKGDCCQANLVVPKVEEDNIILLETFYIDNFSSARLQNKTAQNVLSVHQLNESLVIGLARAWQLKKLLEKGLTTREWEKASGMNKRTFARYINLCYLSPRIISDILEYKNPRIFTLKQLMSLASENIDFQKQEQIWKV